MYSRSRNTTVECRRLQVAPWLHHNLEEWQGSLCNIISKEPPFDQNREDVLLSKTVHKTSLAHDITARDSVILYCVVCGFWCEESTGMFRRTSEGIILVGTRTVVLHCQQFLEIFTEIISIS